MKMKVEMKSMWKLAASVALGVVANAAIAVDTFDPASNKLSLDSVVLNGVVYNNVVVTLNSYTLISVGSSAPYNPVAAACSDVNFTVAKYNAIVPGMTLDQVKQTIGCANDSKWTTAVGSTLVRLGWYYYNPSNRNTSLILVEFDGTGTRVNSDPNNLGLFKSRSGF
jgi:hypothetical protein|nr:hypothetical protein [uncultured Rhodoferax sp.]